MFSYVYILTNKYGRRYVGCTEDLKERIKMHNEGKVPATQFYKPWKVKVYFAFNDKYIAYKFEKYLKTGSGIAFAKKHFV
ncbi:MAG: GIY-YIG nuclease family protein [Microgenomates group bacterium]